MTNLTPAFRFMEAGPTPGDILILIAATGEEEELVTFVSLFHRPGYSIVENESGQHIVVLTGLLFV